MTPKYRIIKKSNELGQSYFYIEQYICKIGDTAQYEKYTFPVPNGKHLNMFESLSDCRDAIRQIIDVEEKLRRSRFDITEVIPY